MKKNEKTIILLLIFAIIVLLVIYFLCEIVTAKNIENKEVFVDINATNEKIEEMSDEEIRKLLSKKVKETEINMTMSSCVIMKNGMSEAPLQIENNIINRYPQFVEIKLKKTNEIIYKSALIPIGYRIDKAKLLKTLGKGEYEAIAYFTSYDEERKKTVGTGGAEIDIVVKN